MLLAMTSLVSIAAAAASMQIITPDDIATMSAEGTGFQLWAGDMTQNYPIPADQLTLQMEATQDSSNWSVYFKTNYPSLELSSEVLYDPTKSYSWTISAGFLAVETSLVFIERIGDEIGEIYLVKLEVLGGAQDDSNECNENDRFLLPNVKLYFSE